MPNEDETLEQGYQPQDPFGEFGMTDGHQPLIAQMLNEGHQPDETTQNAGKNPPSTGAGKTKSSEVRVTSVKSSQEVKP